MCVGERESKRKREGERERLTTDARSTQTRAGKMRDTQQTELSSISEQRPECFMRHRTPVQSKCLSEIGIKDRQTDRQRGANEQKKEKETCTEQRKYRFAVYKQIWEITALVI